MNAADAGEDVTAKLAAFADLPDGWDSYEAPPIDRRAIEAAREFIESVNVAPTNNGGVAVWFFNEAVSIDFGADGDVCGFVIDRDDIRSARAAGGGHLARSCRTDAEAAS